MFLEFDEHFINLAKVDNIAVSTDVDQPDVWELSIEMGDDLGDTIWLREGFSSLAHAEAFKRAVIRHACTTGLCTGDDMDKIFKVTQLG